jgi:preprotein translocase subunit Sec63
LIILLDGRLQKKLNYHTMDMEQVMELLLVFEEKIDVRNAEFDVHHEKMIASQERTIAKIDAWLAGMKDSRKETAACQEMTEANPEEMEANPDEMKSVTVHEEVPKEEATVKYFGTLKK